jgi:tryptophan synthase alpha chain
MNSTTRIDEAFSVVRSQHRAALITYVMAGDPDLAASAALVTACIEGGADIVEIGVPFSDPIADGPVIQRAGQRALHAGTKLSDVLNLAAAVRQQHATPIVLMGYLNPILAMGEQRFMDRCSGVGVDGLIVPDLLPEESATLRAAAARSEIATICLVSTSSTQQRIEAACAASTGFVYLVSVSGVTGARRDLPTNLNDHIARVKAVSSLPVAVGFGISQPHQVAEVGAYSDGVVVGSAIVACAEEAGPGEAVARVSDLVKSLRQATVHG